MPTSVSPVQFPKPHPLSLDCKKWCGAPHIENYSYDINVLPAIVLLISLLLPHCLLNSKLTVSSNVQQILTMYWGSLGLLTRLVTAINCSFSTQRLENQICSHCIWDNDDCNIWPCVSNVPPLHLMVSGDPPGYFPVLLIITCLFSISNLGVVLWGALQVISM